MTKRERANLRTAMGLTVVGSMDGSTFLSNLPGMILQDQDLLSVRRHADLFEPNPPTRLGPAGIHDGVREYRNLEFPKESLQWVRRYLQRD